MSIEAMNLALDALECSKGYVGCESWSPSMLRDVEEAIKALEEALAKQEQGEPVAWRSTSGTLCNLLNAGQKESGLWHPLYTTPQQCKPLTDEQIWDAYMKAPVDIDCHVSDLHKFARAIEAAHGIKE